MSSTRLTFRNLTATTNGVLIGKIELIDTDSGEVLRVANTTPELLRFIESVEIDLDTWVEITKMQEKNPAFKKLIHTLKLYT